MDRLFRVLSIDGGGIRGIVPAIFLTEIERRTGRRIWSLFDLIAGTSAGGIIALGLTKPNAKGGPEYRADEIVDLYAKKGKRIFSSPLLHQLSPLAQGFFLCLREEAFARGDGGTSSDASVYAGATTYWDYDETARAMTYWLFYSGSSPPLGILRMDEQIGLKARTAAGAPADEPPPELEAASAAAVLEEFQQAYPGLAREVEPPAQTKGFADALQNLRIIAAGVRALLRDDDVLHECDWERITVYLDQADPEVAPPASVAFYRHSTNTFKKWDSVTKDAGTHPVAFSAIGSHASLPTPGFGHIDVGDPDGPRWRTWVDLASIVDQPWYGFGGAWGQVGKVRDSTGPLGPGAHWKHAAPRPAQPDLAPDS